MLWSSLDSFCGRTKNLLFIVFEFIIEYAETMIVFVSSTFVFFFFIFVSSLNFTLLITNCLFVCVRECVRLVSGRYGVAMMVGVHFISHLISNIYQRVCIFFVLCVLGFILTIGCRLQSKSITHSNFYRHIAHRTIKDDYQKQF